MKIFYKTTQFFVCGQMLVLAMKPNRILIRLRQYFEKPSKDLHNETYTLIRVEFSLKRLPVALPWQITMNRCATYGDKHIHMIDGASPLVWPFIAEMDMIRLIVGGLVNGVKLTFINL